MENQNEIIEISVKVIFLGEFNDFNSWIKNVQECANKYGVNSKILHMDCQGYTTTGYEMKNQNREAVYPVKTYLLVQALFFDKPSPFKSTSNN